MCFNICIYATDLCLKVFTERYGDKNCVDFVQSRQFFERIFMFMYMCQGCAYFWGVLLKRNALIMLLLYMFVISLNLFIMYQSYGGSKLNLMRCEVTGSKMKWGETGGYRYMKDNINAELPPWR